jgi:hypothetical protein
VAALELHLDLGIGFIDAVSPRNQPVVDPDQEHHENYQDYADYEQGRHVAPSDRCGRSSQCGEFSLAGGISGNDAGLRQ